MRLLVLLFMFSISSASAQQLTFEKKAFNLNGRSYDIDQFRIYLHHYNNESDKIIEDFESFAEAHNSGNAWGVASVMGTMGSVFLLITYFGLESSGNYIESGVLLSGLVLTAPFAIIGSIGNLSVKRKRKRKLNRFLDHFNSELSTNEQHDINLNIGANGLGVSYSF